MPLADQKEEWWVSVMGVGLDPELTKWSVRSGPANVLTGKGYKEHHWLVVPHQPPRLSPITSVLVNAFFLSYHPRHSEPVRYWLSCSPRSWANR